MLFDTDNTMFIVIRCTMFSSKIIVVNGVIIVELLKPVMFKPGSSFFFPCRMKIAATEISKSMNPLNTLNHKMT